MTAINPNYVPASFYDSSGNLTVSPELAQQVSEGVAAKVANMPPAQAELFLLMLKSADLAPTGEISPENLGDMLDRLERAAVALTTLSAATGSAIDLLARLMIEQAGQQRKDALEERLQSREQAKTALLGQAEKMMEAADKMLQGALVSMIVTVIAGALQAIGGALSLAGGIKGFSATKDAMKAFDKATDGIEQGTEAFKTANNQLKGALQQVQNITNIAQGSSQLAQGIGQIGKGIGDYIAAEEQHDSKDLEAQGQIDAALAQYLQGQTDIKKEMQDALNQMIQSIINFIKEMREAEVNMMQAITRG